MFSLNYVLISISIAEIEFLYLPEVEDDTIWEDDRNKFLKSIEKKM